MKHVVYKLSFPGGVHLGNGFLNDSDGFIRADQLFSGLFIEALKDNREQDLLSAVQKGELLLSDAMPYKEDVYYLPKPMVLIDHSDTEQTDSVSKKWYKNLKYIPADHMQQYLAGTLEAGSFDCHFGEVSRRASVGIRTGSDPEPYHVGIYHFYEHCGLYFIADVDSDAQELLLDDLLRDLSFSGIGGGKTRGLGRFEVRKGEKTDKLIALLGNKGTRYILLNGALPKDDELDTVLTDATYLLEKRSGFVASSGYAEEQQKKKDLLVFSAGSCFTRSFAGDIFDVSNGGRHPVYRYAKGMFFSV
ncbi:MAG: type III-A CRISPR-associated RAMP protein Csm4 [Lachnospiraceae bacterium]|nr:type III-A CRISPR-associated RAMP protein Csm4 [Lachnospiraceae bacterium]